MYVPATDELFTAARGDGAHAQRRAHPLQHHRPISRWRWWPPGSATTPSGVRRRPSGSPRCSPQVRDIRRLGAAAADLCYVAAGRVDVYFEEWLGPWDLAAGELIAREAGCRTGDSRRRPGRTRRRCSRPTRQLFGRCSG